MAFESAVSNPLIVYNIDFSGPNWSAGHTPGQNINTDDSWQGGVYGSFTQPAGGGGTTPLEDAIITNQTVTGGLTSTATEMIDNVQVQRLEGALNGSVNQVWRRLPGWITSLDQTEWAAGSTRVDWNRFWWFQVVFRAEFTNTPVSAGDPFMGFIRGSSALAAPTLMNPIPGAQLANMRAAFGMGHDGSGGLSWLTYTQGIAYPGNVTDNVSVDASFFDLTRWNTMDLLCTSGGPQSDPSVELRVNSNSVITRNFSVAPTIPLGQTDQDRWIPGFFLGPEGPGNAWLIRNYRIRAGRYNAEGVEILV